MKSDKKSKPTAAKIPDNPERAFGDIVKRLRVSEMSKASKLIKAGARCVKKGADGYHLEWDAEALQTSEA
tara:strand:+ start:2860 stop:3069 length:210 start_codon:yes stop_codon:yes gene_type:complete